MRRNQLVVLVSLAVAVAGCAEQEPASSSTRGPSIDGGRALRDVLDAKLAEIGDTERDEGAGSLELRADTGLLPGEEEREPQPDDTDYDADLDPELVEFRDGLVSLAASRPRDMALVRHDFEAAGAKLGPVIAAGLRNVGRDPAELHVLAQLADVSPSEDVARALVELAGTAEPAWLRASAAQALVKQRAAAEADVVVPALLYRTKYERDPEALAWTYAALAGFGNGAGYRTNSSSSEPSEGLATKLANAGIETPLAAPTPSAALRNEVWRWIADLSGEHFQLRGVDDARYVLSNLESWAAEELALALEDDDSYVRLHTAQVLERMGARGVPARESLVAALRDPSVGVQGVAAEALARVAGADALNVLIERLDEAPPYETQVALVRALSQLPASARPVARLRDAFESARASDMRLAAAEGLLATDSWREVLLWLADELVAQVGDPAGAEAALETALADDGPLAELRESWLELGPEAALIHTAEEARARRVARAALIRDLVRSDLD